MPQTLVEFIVLGADTAAENQRKKYKNGFHINGFDYLR